VNHEPEHVRETIERYLLGEMSPEEEAQWEAHYLECSDCLKALERAKKLSRFLKHEATLEDGLLPKPGSKSGWFERFSGGSGFRPLLAAAGLVIVVGIIALGGWMRAGSLQRQIEELQLPSVPLVSFSLQGPRRGTGGDDAIVRQEFQLPPGSESFLLAVPPLTAMERSSIYRAHVVGPDGNVVWSSPNLGFASRTRRFTIVCQSSFFVPGDYELRVEEVRPTDEKLLATFRFPFRLVEEGETDKEWPGD
jgi:hypothetical protein